MNQKFQDKISALVEQRIIEATKKQMTQKLLLISKFLGKPVIAHSVLGNTLEDPWRLEEDMIYDPTKIPIQDPDGISTSERGYHFDGLYCGINLVVTTLIYDDKVSELKATYKGYLVFAEVEGELKAYAPFPAWEDSVNMFHEAAVQIEKKRSLELRTKREVVGRQKMTAFWQKFRMLWGY